MLAHKTLSLQPQPQTCASTPDANFAASFLFLLILLHIFYVVPGNFTAKIIPVLHFHILFQKAVAEAILRELLLLFKTKPFVTKEKVET